ncbi:pectin lyase fold/virulence factor [Cladochytrium replicatum]|nr:pectin lyase fold/virulence factor [Cladochytrium replicatum]
MTTGMGESLNKCSTLRQARERSKKLAVPLESCSPNPQQAINKVNYCNGQKATTVTYYKAGLNPIDVGSNISIPWTRIICRDQRQRSSYQQNNVIVQKFELPTSTGNLFGGAILGSTNVWIDHNYFNRIGRQQLFMGYNPSSSVTVSNNEFKGKLTFGAPQSGSGPHIGGTSGYVTKLHMVNNYFSDVSAQAIETYVGDYVIAEGNYFENVDTGEKTGTLFAATSSSQVGARSSYFGRLEVARSAELKQQLFNSFQAFLAFSLCPTSGTRMLLQCWSWKDLAFVNWWELLHHHKGTTTTKPASSPSPVAGCASLYGQWCCSSGKCTVSNHLLLAMYLSNLDTGSLSTATTSGLIL